MIAYPRMTITGDQNPNYRHGLTDGKKYRHPIYIAWQNMKSRCYNKNNAKYHRYGGRGIIVCNDWLNIENFLKWCLMNGWSEGLSIDRKNNDGNYEPDNCQWISKPRNSRKKSTTKLTIEQAIEIRDKYDKGENDYELAKQYGVCHGTIWFIIKNRTWLPI